MSLKVGIVGLPNVGKSTIFNALTKSSVSSENFPFCTIDPNHGVVPIPDKRLNQITTYIKTEKIIPTVVEFVDIAGLVKGASAGEGLGNTFLSHIRDVDAIIHVVRCFEDNNITHVEGNVDPIRDLEIINTELIIKDLDTLEKRIKKIERQAKSKIKDALEEYNCLIKIQNKLNNNESINKNEFGKNDLKTLKSLALLTLKPMMYLANISEDNLMDENNKILNSFQEYCLLNSLSLVSLCGDIEMQIAIMSDEDQKIFCDEYKLDEPGLNMMIRGAYNLLNLETYFTAGPKEVRAWTIKKNTKAPQGAGVIHTDFERGFIKAEVYHIDDLINYQSESKIKTAGKIRQEGKEYIIQDGDIILFKFNV